jgi:hypothetical protein
MEACLQVRHPVLTLRCDLLTFCCSSIGVIEFIPTMRKMDVKGSTCSQPLLYRQMSFLRFSDFSCMEDKHYAAFRRSCCATRRETELGAIDWDESNSSSRAHL